MKLLFIFALTSFASAQGLRQYNNRQDFFNNYRNEVIPYCIFGNEPVCSTKDETFANQCVLMLLGQKLKSKGWCEQKVTTENIPKSDKTSQNGYGAGSDKECPFCNDIFNPVCGTNGVTYANLCKLRECGRIDVANMGPCGIPDYKATLQPCNCPFNFSPVCGQDYVTYQSLCIMNCAGTKLQNEGSCIRNCGCSTLNKPVCGMDRKTYKNECELKCAGVPKLHDGECPNPKPPGCEHCEGFFNAVCGVNGVTYDNLCYLQCAKVNLFCRGPCPSIRTNCQCHQRYVPVCGIDNKTYRNDCLMECAEIRKQYNGICRNYEVDNSEIFGKCKCGNQQQAICGADGRTYLNPCYLDCLGGGKAVHWGECKHINPKSCGCQNDGVPVCGNDLKTYQNQCAANCMNVKQNHQGTCGSVGLMEDKSNTTDLIQKINDEFTFQF